MEALLFMLNSITVVLMVFMGLRDDRRPAGAPHTSLFRTRDLPAAAAAADKRDAGASEMAAPGWADGHEAGRSGP